MQAQSLRTRTSWRYKLEKPQEPRIIDTPPRMAKAWGTGKMLIPTPMLCDGLIRSIPRGKVATVNLLMKRLARDYSCNATCPMTTGIFLRIVAEAAEEARRAGKKKVTPYWRVLKSDGSLNDRYPGGTELQASRLREEGHEIEASTGRKPPRVLDYAAKLATM